MMNSFKISSPKITICLLFLYMFQTPEQTFLWLINFITSNSSMAKRYTVLLPTYLPTYQPTYQQQLPIVVLLD